MALGWFSRKNAVSDAEKMEAAFMDGVQRISSLLPEARAAFVYGVAFAWRAFNVKFSSVPNFLQQPQEIKVGFIESMEAMQLQLAAKGDPEVGAGIYLTTMYFVALLEGTGAMVNRMADKLEPFNREGTMLLNALRR
jgi:hypothetical protein